MQRFSGRFIRGGESILHIHRRISTVVAVAFFCLFALQVCAVEVREVVPGTVVGFIVPDGHALPAYLTAHDGKPEPVFMPQIKGVQSSDLYAEMGKKKIYETYFGRHRFRAILKFEKSAWSIDLLDGRRLKVQQPVGDPGGANPAAVAAADIPMIYGNSPICDAPDGSVFRFVTSEKDVLIGKYFVLNTRLPQYSCWHKNDLGDIDDPSRTFDAQGGGRSLVDLRGGALVSVSANYYWLELIGKAPPAWDVPRFVVRVDLSRKYSNTHMFSPDILMLDEVSLFEFKRKMLSVYEVKTFKHDLCLRSKGLPIPDFAIPYVKYLQDTRAASGCPVDYGPGWVDEKFVEEFVPAAQQAGWRD